MKSLFLSDNHSLYLVRQFVLILVLYVFFGSMAGYANNIKVTNVGIVSQNTSQNYSLIKFDLSWDHSWRRYSSPVNHDAAWIFIKYRRNVENRWHHAKLHYVNGTGASDGHTVPTNGVLKSSNDNGGTANGVILYRSSYITNATVNYNNIKLRWDYGANGLTDQDSIEVRVYAIEMVYIKAGYLYLGSGGNEYHHFYKRPTLTTTYQITSENAISFGYSTGKLFTANTTNTLISYTIPSAYPKGYDAFYCMKYEISQGQYVDFLNSILPAAATNRYAGKNGFNRNHITVSSSGAYSTSTAYIACNYLSWEDIAAYLDWAALRPMSEFEYEKACRASQTPVANEYAWGSSLINISQFSYNNKLLGSSAESITGGYSTSSGNAALSNTIGTIPGGPLRCGIFAANQSSTGRQTAGATYHGVMEMSGNVSEFVVGIWHSEGRSFTGNHGDGNLSTDGNANTASWPTVNGVGRRGGSFSSSSSVLKVSYRGQCYSNTNVTYRSKEYGGRGVRSF